MRVFREATCKADYSMETDVQAQSGAQQQVGDGGIPFLNAAIA